MKYATSIILLICILVPHFAYAEVNTHAAVFVSASSQYAIDTTSTSLPTGSGARTDCAWIKTTNTTDGNTFYAYGQEAGGPGHQWSLQIGGTDLFTLRTNGGRATFTATNINNNAWHLICVAYTAGSNINTLVAYMDSSSLTISSSIAQVPDTFQDKVVIGANSDLTVSNFFNGSVDDVRTWTRVLSGAEVSSLYSDPCNFSNGTNLISWWRLDNDFNDVNTTNNLTAINTPTFTTSAAYTCSSGIVTPFVHMQGDNVIEGDVIIQP